MLHHLRANLVTLAAAKTRVAVAALALAALLAPAAPAAAQKIVDDPIDPATIPEAIRGLEYKDRLGEKIPLDLEFTDSAGQRVTLGKFFGQAAAGAAGSGPAGGATKPVAMMLVYFRCPMQCPGMLARMYQRLSEMDIAVGDKFNVLIVSFDPTDMPAKAAQMKAAALAGYKGPRSPNLESSWEYLTDSTGNGTKLAVALGFPVRYLAPVNEYAHGSDLFILSPDGTISRYLGFDPPAQTFRLSLVEASEGKIATTLDRILLWCFHFDPQSNSYVVQAWRFMQVGAAATALTLGGILGWMMVIERRRRRNPRGPASASVAATAGSAPAAGAATNSSMNPSDDIAAGRRRAPGRVGGVGGIRTETSP